MRAETSEQSGGGAGAAKEDPAERTVSGSGIVPNTGPAPRARGFGGATPIGEQVGFTTYGGAVGPEDYGDPDDVGPPPPRVVPGIGPRPCPPPPQIIRVGRGLAHPARTRVVYGAPPPCGIR